MAGAIKGVTIEFRGDTTKLDKALRDINKETAKIDKELKQVDKGLKFNPSSVDLWRQKQQLLTQKINETKDKLNLLKDEQARMDAAGVDKNSAEYRKLQREIITTESKLKSFESELRKIGNVKLKALSEQFKKAGDKMTSAGKTLTTRVTAPLAGLGVASLKAGADFDTAMSQVAATSGKTVDEIGDLRDFAIEMGSSTAFSATQAAEGLNYMALAGYDADESMAMLPTVLNLAAAGAMELGAASDMVTDAQTALGLSMEETTTMVDQMAKTASTTNTSVSQLGEAILTIGPTAKNLSGGTNELNQTLGLLADNGIKGAEAGTHLRNIMLALNPQTDKAAQAWDKLGVSAYDADGDLRPLQDTFGDLQQALSGMSSEDRTAILSQMFNKTDLASINALLETDASRWNEVGTAIDGAAGSAAQMADTQLDNMQGSLTLLKSALEGAGIAVSDVLAPAIRTLAEFITSLVTKFNELSPTAQKVIVTIAAIAAAIGPALIVFGALASGIGSVMSLAGTLGTVIGALAGPIGIAIAAIAAIVAIGVVLYKNWDTIKAKAAALKSSVIATFNGLKSKVQSTWNAIKTAITKPIQTAVNTVRNAISKLKGILRGKLSFPKIKLPHFTVTGKFSLNPPSVPKLGVKWYDKGGIFDSPSIIGVGEKRPEFVGALDDLRKIVREESTGENVTFNIYAAPGMDVKKIADAVEQRLVDREKQRRAAWGY